MSDETLLWKQKQWSARIILMMKAIGNYATSVIIICWIESKIVGRLKKVIAHGNRETDSQLLCMYPTTSYLRWTLGHKRENPFFFFFLNSKIFMSKGRDFPARTEWKPSRRNSLLVKITLITTWDRPLHCLEWLLTRLNSSATSIYIPILG